MPKHPQERAPESGGGGGPSARSHVARTTFYAARSISGDVDASVISALKALRPFSARLVVITTGSPNLASREALAAVADAHHHHSSDTFSKSYYADALRAEASGLPAPDEILLTGDGWFGPAPAGLGAVFAAMEESSAQMWELIEQRARATRDFTRQGFPLQEEPYLWTSIRGERISSALWRTDDATPLVVRAERDGWNAEAMFTAEELGSVDPALLSVRRLLAKGCPVLPRAPFIQYPPFLEQHAVIGREIFDEAITAGFDAEEMLGSLTRVVPPKDLNTNLGLLDVLPAVGGNPTDGAADPPRVLALVHATDVHDSQEILDRLDYLPVEYDIVMTTTDGLTAATLSSNFKARPSGRARSFEVRVAPMNSGRDMSDLFIANRDLVLAGRYDLIVRLRSRAMASKTHVVQRYFRRYQFENLLASPEHASEILELFRREPRLGLVFPPMVHIGYQTLGRAWGPYKPAAERVAADLGIAVPLDSVSPLAPFGGMFFARPEALSLMAGRKWTYRDYAGRGRRAYKDLARVQERLLTAAAAESGFHSRTILTPSHAAISYTAVEFKSDEIASTTAGYPVDRIQLLHRAGPTGRGGIVGLSRMYMHLNFPRLAALLHPFMVMSERWFMASKSSLGNARHRAGALLRREAGR